MKLKTPNGILIIDILSVLLIILIIFIPSSIARVVLGLPFILFFPGYTLLAALFIKKEGMDIIERVALSCVISIAIVFLIGFGLNYTPFGIRLEPVLYTITAFIFVTSAVAFIRRVMILKINKFAMEFALSFPVWANGTFKKHLLIILIVVTSCALAILGYTLAAPKIGERFTQFYVLGINDKPEDYPTEYFMNNGKITEVIYGNGTVDAKSGFGTVTLEIVNHEQQTVVYTVKMTINGEPINIEVNGTNTDVLGPIELKQGEKWENEIGIIPNYTGNNQKVELLLFKGTETAAESSLYLWINVKQAE